MTHSFTARYQINSPLFHSGLSFSQASEQIYYGNTEGKVWTIDLNVGQS